MISGRYFMADIRKVMMPITTRPMLHKERRKHTICLVKLGGYFFTTSGLMTTFFFSLFTTPGAAKGY
tara:strand:- start:507 stop:707 length:201 start_codon:yes stop_codon:yes gene_type:complete